MRIVANLFQVHLEHENRNSFYHILRDVSDVVMNVSE